MNDRAQLDGGSLWYRLAPIPICVLIVIGAEVTPDLPATMTQYANTAALELLVIAALVGVASLVVSPIKRIPDSEDEE